MARPTVRDLAESAADLRGFSVRFQDLLDLEDEEGNVQVSSETLVRASAFMNNVAEELLSLIGPNSPLPPAPPAPLPDLETPQSHPEETDEEGEVP